MPLGVIHKERTHGRGAGRGGDLSQCERYCISKWMTSHKLCTGGVKNPDNFAYVLYGWPLTIGARSSLPFKTKGLLEENADGFAESLSKSND